MIQPVPHPPSPVPHRSEALRILPLSDLHLPRSPQSEMILANRNYLDAADFVVFLGDMVRAYATPREYGAVREFANKVARPFTAVAGNHEFYFESVDDDSPQYGEHWERASDDEERGKLDAFTGFWRLEELWRSFDTPLGRFVFLSLDSVGTTKQEALSDRQLEFLSTQLETSAPLFVFCHAPLLLEHRLDLVYYEEARSACIEPEGALLQGLLSRTSPTYWMSGHIHLHPDHHLFPPYRAGGNVWQIHCPDSRGYGRLVREHRVPVLYEGVYSRHLEIDATGVSFVTHSHSNSCDIGRFRLNF